MSVKQIFRVPVDTKHFEDTIVTGKLFTEIAPRLTSEELKRIPVGKDRKVRYWGSVPGRSNTRLFEQMQAGDELLCYRSGKYVACAIVVYSAVNPQLARFSWEETSRGDTWELIYFLKDVTLLSVDTAIVNEQWGYKGGPVMGLSKIADVKAQPFLQEYGSVATFLDKQFAKSAM